MTEIHNAALKRLRNGEVALGIGIRIGQIVEIAGAMQAAGYDWLFIDLEHGAMPLQTATQIAVAAIGVGIAPLVRVPVGEIGMATRALDNGALGIVMPHVNTAEEARELVDKLKYPPVGHRSIGGNGAQIGFQPGKIASSTGALNDATLTVVMLETPTAIANAETIAKVPGVDVLLVGTNDLCAELGIHGQHGHEKIVAACNRVVEVCKANGKHPGMAGVGSEALQLQYIKAGARFILAGTDLPMMMDAAGRRASALRQGPTK